MLLTAAVSAGLALAGLVKWLPADAWGRLTALKQAARTGRWDRSRYAGRSEARMDILGAAAARGWRLAEVRSAIGSGDWQDCTSGVQSPAAWPGCCLPSGEDASVF